MRSSKTRLSTRAHPLPSCLNATSSTSDAAEGHLSQPFVPGQHAPLPRRQPWPTRRQPPPGRLRRGGAYDRARTRKLTPEKAQELRHARWCVYASQFLHKVALGRLLRSVALFYLALFIADAAAANVATAEWAAYSIGQVLCTPFLERPRISGKTPVFVVCAAITIVFLVLFWPNLYCQAITGFIQGCFSCVGRQYHNSGGSCVSERTRPAVKMIFLIMRLFRRIATPASETLDGEVRQELAVAVTALWFVVCQAPVGRYGR